KGLMFHLEKEANTIAKRTRRGRGNWIVCTSDVASALSSAGLLDYGTNLKDNLNVDDTGDTFVGVLNGRFKVYIDPYVVGSNFLVVGYKGANPYDAGLFYCPYVPLQMMRAVDQNQFQPKIAFKTRYGIVAHPFSNFAGNSNGSIVANSNEFFRKMAITSL
ncbi:ATP-binding protein, partial [bacterium]|nr:ATP-binding protein [Candidatus Elulimicrobium humile]